MASNLSERTTEFPGAARVPPEFDPGDRCRHRRRENAVTQDQDLNRLEELLEDVSIGMLTTFGDSGPRSVPMARQEVEHLFAEGPVLWFITARDTAHTRAIRAEPRVALTFSSRATWVALTGRAAVVDDHDKLEELWNTWAEAWLPGGPEDPQATLLRVEVEEGEYWDTPGGRVASLLSFAKTLLTGETYDAEHGRVEV
jgi:general stress protein 26